MTIALVSDSVSAAVLFDGHIVLGIIIHLGAALIWLAARVATNPLRSDTLIAFLSTEIGAEFCVILCLFPGLGMISAAAGIASNFLFGPEPRTKHDPQDGEVIVNSLITNIINELTETFDPMVELRIQPLADKLANATGKEKRAAIDLICRRPHPHGMRIARQLLADSDPDVRALAAVAIDKLATYQREAEGENRVQEALDS